MILAALAALLVAAIGIALAFATLRLSPLTQILLTGLVCLLALPLLRIGERRRARARRGAGSSADRKGRLPGRIALALALAAVGAALSCLWLFGTPP